MSPVTTLVSSQGYWSGPGFGAHGWTSGDNRAKKWTYWWLTIQAESIHAENLTSAEYEILCENNVVVPRTRLVESQELFKKTRVVDEEPDPPGQGPIGGAEKLDAGVYAVDFYLTAGATDYQLRGVRFEVAERKSKKGGWQIKTPLPDETA